MKIFNKNKIMSQDIINRIMDSKPNQMEIAIDDLVVDRSYQRICNAARVRKITRNLDWDLFGVIIVSYRDGVYYIVDGQHRVEAVRGLVDKVTCLVWNDLTYEEECEKFLKLNSERHSCNANQKFHARVQFGEEFANSTVDAMKKYNFTYNPDCGTAKDNVIGSVPSIERIASSYGIDALDNVLDVLRSSWYGGSDSLESSLIKGLNTFLIEYQSKVDKATLCRALERYSPKNIKLKAIYNINAENLSGVTGGGGTKEHIAKTIRDVYNNESPKNMRLV